MSKRRRARYGQMARWSPAIALGRTRRRIDEAKEALADVAITWGDVDQLAVDRAEELIALCEELWLDIDAQIRSRQAEGQEVGL